jgi:uncharacterized membrane protein YqhA
MFRRILAGSRYFVLLAVVGSFMASVAVLVHGVLTVIVTILSTFSHSELTAQGARHLSMECVEIIDLFLLGTVLYIIALGLYELFIDRSLPMPYWLHVSSLDDLKDKLLGTVVVMLGVSFLGDVVTWEGQNNILALGAAIAVVVGSLRLLNLVGGNHDGAEAPGPSAEGGSPPTE